ncbi:VDE lipocalin diadinoxanthin de-epoxidase domain containing protein [Nitzschia inconspicua]|uniref:VDE lipocalin diadinoxanthin de-epoxidase domain containing protein n=1 Tax=Nitzschia inconspicua TaxID=303405 RepID=A0A9K3PPV5_9STRA|nr:VDE lipocalin diadinoxanthin de-epoxidase domain containing protein [Nitzschia inconspicua]
MPLAPLSSQPKAGVSSTLTQLDAHRRSDRDQGLTRDCHGASTIKSATAAFALSLAVSTATLCGGNLPALAADKYDGFADYAKENQMQQSDVGCFINKCKEQTIALFSNPRGIKGTTCLGQCKGEQACSTRCFAQYGSEDLDNWLSCAIEENECVKVPKDIDNSAEDIGFTTTVKEFDPKSLVGKWYKTDGLNPNYDLFDCQTNTFEATEDDASELDMGITLRVRRPEEAGGGYWENNLMEHMVVDAVKNPSSDPGARTMHTKGKMYGLQFEENWYVLGESDGKKDIPPFKLVAFKGHTLQGNYEGSFVYAKEPRLPEAAIPTVREAAAKAGLNWDDYQRIDNTCPAGNALNDAAAGTGTSPADWLNLVVGEGGVIDWISPGWRGEYKK